MPTYTVTGINIGSFLLGEADKVLTAFTAECGLVRMVAKSARKPGTKMAGRADLLCVNRLLLAPGRTFEIITQADTVESFPELRQDLTLLAYGLYYAELTQVFGAGLADEAQSYFDFLIGGLRLLAREPAEPAWLCLAFELGLLDQLGYKPELTCCVSCRQVLNDYTLSTFDRDAGGIVCQSCTQRERRGVAEGAGNACGGSWKEGIYITPGVWKALVLADAAGGESAGKAPAAQVTQAARRLVQGYLEHRAGKHLRALDLLLEDRVC